MNISEPQAPIANEKGVNHALWQLTFRSFFLAGSLFSALSIALWLFFLTGTMKTTQVFMPSVAWHAHEMIFGFAALIAVGFILTAVQTWTGKPSITGLPVILLLLMWALIRVLLLANTQLSVLWALALTFAWWCSVVSIYARIVVSAKNRRNYLFIPLITVLGLLNVTTLSFSLLEQHQTSLHIARSAVLMFTMIMAVVGGRVIPFFTVRGANTQVKDSIVWLEKALLPISILGISVFIIGYFLEIPLTPAVFMITAGCLHLIRMTRWSSVKTVSVPLLWSLHLSYAFMGIGLISLGLSYHVASLQFSAALHLITVGAIGLMIIAMMSRVSLGHTGRLLKVKQKIVVAFTLIVLAAISRFLLPHLGLSFEAWIVSAACWVIAFFIFFINYWPVLTTPRQ